MRALTATLGVLFLVFALYVQSTIKSSVDNLRSAVHEIKKESPLEKLVYIATWKDAAGINHTVKSTQEDDEALDAFKLRHKNAVNGLAADFPPVQ
jgi:hypothetical protein